MSKEKVLITGGAGYLGSVMTGKLLQEGYKVTCLDNLLWKQHSPLFFMDCPDYDFIFGDARDQRILEPLISRHDSILPLAAIVGYPACDSRPEAARTTNKDAIIMLNSLRGSQQKLIFPTTNSGYGTTSGEVLCDENTPLNPISLYGETKAAAEEVLLKNNKPSISFRLATVFGNSPRMRLDLLVNDLVYQASTTGEITLFEKKFMRNFVHIQDVSRAFVFALENYEKLCDEKIYNLGHPQANISKEDLVLRIKNQIPSLIINEDLNRTDPDKRNYIVSSQRIMNYGFRFNHTLESGISELIRAMPLLRMDYLRQVSTNQQPI